MSDSLADWAWIAVIGALLEIAGLTLAVVGVAKTKRTLFENRPLPPARLWAATKFRFGKWVLRRKPTTVNISANLSGGVTLTSNAYVELIRPRPTTDKPSLEWIRYLEQRLTNVEERQTRESDQTRTQIAKVEQRATKLETDIHEQATATEINLRRAIGGDDGAGLDWTFWGLAITAIGVALQAVSTIVAR